MSPSPASTASNSTANHCSDSYHNIFGGLNSLAVLQGTIAIVIIIFAIIFLEFTISYLHELANDSAFADMLNVIERELMIVGLLAFIFKTIKLSISSDWYYALEFADTFIPITAFFFCFQGGLFIVTSSERCRMWSKGYQLHIFEILSEFYEGYHLSMDRFRSIRVFWVDSMLDRVEFRVVHILFCNHFHLETTAFEFDEYVIRVFEKFIVEIIDAKPEHWAVVTMIVLLNWVRVELGWFTGNCLNEGCQVSQQVTLFTAIGTVIFSVNLLLLLFSKHYERTYFRNHKLNSIFEYAAFLELNEEVFNCKEGPRLRHQKISMEDLKILARAAKSSSKSHKVGGVTRKSAGLLRKSLREFQLRKSISYARSSIKKGLADLLNKGVLNTLRTTMVETAASRYRVHPAYEKLFVLSSPSLYFIVVEHMLMIISLYCGLWVSNFQESIKHLPSPDRHTWMLFSALPGLLSVCLFILIVRSAAFLKAITSLDAECVFQTIEHSEELKDIGRVLKQSLLDCLSSNNDPEEQLKMLYKSIRDDGSMALNREEFVTMLRAMNIEFSVKRWRQILKQIDRNHDDNISLNEVLLFLFPEHLSAKKAEHQYLRDVALEMRDRATQFADLVGRDKTNLKLGSQFAGYNRKSYIKMVPKHSRFSFASAQNIFAGMSTSVRGNSTRLKVVPHGGQDDHELNRHVGAHGSVRFPHHHMFGEAIERNFDDLLDSGDAEEVDAENYDSCDEGEEKLERIVEVDREDTNSVFMQEEVLPGSIDAVDLEQGIAGADNSRDNRDNSDEVMGFEILSDRR